MSRAKASKPTISGSIPPPLSISRCLATRSFLAAMMMTGVLFSPAARASWKSTSTSSIGKGMSGSAWNLITCRILPAPRNGTAVLRTMAE